MRPLWTATLLLALSGCNCGGPPQATPIKLVAKNTLPFDIFVPNDSVQGGMTVGRGDSSSFAAIVEAPTCSCLQCVNACLSPTCNCSPKPMAHRLHPGDTFSRTFDGTEHPASRADCGAGDLGPVCYQDGEAIDTGTYALQLCYATNVDGADQNQTDFSTTFDPAALVCVTGQYAYPTQTEWDISPAKPNPCGASNACPSGQLCQQGVCSASCLANTVPTVGSGWRVSVGVTQDEGFFARANGRYTGTGQLGSVNYGQGQLDLRLSSTTGAIAELAVQIPSTITALPFTPGETVSVLAIPLDPTNASSPAAIVMRNAAGQLLLAAELDTGTAALSATDLAPFTVASDGTPFACDTVMYCGRNTYSSVVFSAGGSSATVAPGQSAPLSADGVTWDATSVANSQLPDTAPPAECTPLVEFGYAIVARGQL